MDTGQWLTLVGNVVGPSIGFGGVALGYYFSRKKQTTDDNATLQSAFMHESAAIRQERIAEIASLKAEIRLIQTDIEEKDKIIQALREENFNLRTQVHLLKTHPPQLHDGTQDVKGE